VADQVFDEPLVTNQRPGQSDPSARAKLT
jgi:hypothetical protein